MPQALIRKGTAAAAIGIVSVAAVTGAGRAEDFHKLSGAQIRAKFVGMELTDEVHSGEIYGPNGALTVFEMGQKKSGHWRIQNDRLCREIGEAEHSCYEVWISGKRVELRSPGSKRLPFEGALQKPRCR